MKAAPLYALLVFRVVCLQLALMGREREQQRYTRIVTLKQGRLQGRLVRSKRNAYAADVEAYLGVPYAAPPVGNLRFMPPGAPPQWPDTLEAVSLKPVCPQMLPDLENAAQRRASVHRTSFVKRMRQHLLNESEDCLYLNIYVPRPHRREHGGESKKYPVVLFVHGESFEWNSGNLYDGSVVAGLGNVIFITINFRLGIFGFLKQGLTVGRANFGLSDQIASLQWTKKNIGEFGGDATKITVMGHGTGAACVNFLMLSPVAEGLFHRAILMSGSALSDWALTATPLHYIQLQDEFNCSSDDVVDCLQRKRKEDIVSAFKQNELLPFENFTPVIDEIVVLNSPADQMEKYSLFSKYDLLAGVTEIESYFLLEEEFLKLGMLNREGHTYLDKYARAVFKKTPDKALMKIIEHYLGHLRDNSPIAKRDAVLDALSDLLVTAPLLQTVRYHAATPKNTFLYVFGHRTASEHGIKSNRSVYGDELPYFLGVPIDGPSHHYQSEYTPQEEQLSEATLKYFTNFAKTGNPYSSTSSEFGYTAYSVNRLANTRWPPYNLDQQSYMYFGTTTQIRHHYRLENDLFWNQEMLKSMKQFDESASRADGGHHGDTNDDVENDENHSPPVYGFPPGSLAEVGGNVDNNFLNAAPGWPSNVAASGDEILGAAAPPPLLTPPIKTSIVPQMSFAAIAIVAIALLFLLANVVAFGVIFYQRGKLRMRENLFRDRFRCKTVSIPDLFVEDESGEVQAVVDQGCHKHATVADPTTAAVASGMTKSTNRPNKVMPKRRGKGGGNNGARVASVKPEAMSGKRMRRWPLSRQCSGSTITMDAHSKVRDWIVNEVAAVAAAATRNATPRFSRKSVTKKRSAAGGGGTRSDGNGFDGQTNEGGIEMRTIERRRSGAPLAEARERRQSVIENTRTLPSSLISPSSPPSKVSIAIDATQFSTSRKMGSQGATRIPIEAAQPTKDNGRTQLDFAIGQSTQSNMDISGSDDRSSSGFCIKDGDKESQNVVGTHKSSAHIRLKTPQFLLEASPAIWHSHSRSDPSPVNAPTPPVAASALYSGIGEWHKKQLESFADSQPQMEVNQESTLSHHCEGNIVTSLPDAEGSGNTEDVSLAAQQMLRTLVRRNFPKVLPDLATLEQKRAYRSSFPAVGASAIVDSCTDCHIKHSNCFSRIPPAPPPRVTSTLGRRPAATSNLVRTASEDEPICGTATWREGNEVLLIAEERAPDIVQTESCHSPQPLQTSVGIHSASSTLPGPSCTTSGDDKSQNCQKKLKDVRSVTTSTTGIS